MSYSPNLFPEFVKERIELASKLESMDDQIKARMDYIIRTMYSAFNIGIEYWFPNMIGDGTHFLPNDFSEEFMSPYVTLDDDGRYDLLHNSFFFIKDEIVYLGNGFPIRWLFESFEDEFLAGKKKFEDQKFSKKKMTSIRKKFNVDR